ncbi:MULTISPECIES: hypothetical protein [Pseudomonas]|uniref:hypothetical protein n=1 Tax=Pseudomonas TaxID=286 RepID=UPI000F03F4AB|nr:MULTISPECIES: hypothetical protein [Pseudomonas]MCV4289902.1 hypothetical protein [Pseudomonas capsici]
MIYALDHKSRDVRVGTNCEVEGPSFLATITSIHTGKRDRAALIRCAYELQHYLTLAQDVAIEAIQMLCPPDLTGRDHWSLEELVQIVCYRGIETDEGAVVYRTSMGTYKLGDLDLRKRKTRQVWYSEQRLRSHFPKASNRVIELSEPYLYAAIP